jgi:hypothetical protein
MLARLRNASGMAAMVTGSGCAPHREYSPECGEGEFCEVHLQDRA